MSGYPRFAPDAELVVDAHNGPETWTGAEWNAYVEAAERDSNMVTCRLIECPQPLGLAGFCEHGVGMLDQCDDCCPPAEVTP